MKTRTLLLLLVGFVFSFVLPLFAQHSLAQNFPAYHQLGPAKATLWRPSSGTPNIGIDVVMHRTSNFLNLGACSQMRDRGFVVLCMNTRFDNNESEVIFEEMALDVRAGINFLKQNQSGLTPGINKVVLWGYSGGGPTMSFYQAVAEVGVGFCQAPQKLTQCDSSGSTSLVGLPKADGIIFVDAHPGNPIIGMLRSNNPAVHNENHPENLRDRLNPYDPANGYNPNGLSTYSDAFKKRYFEGQSDRLNKLIAEAQDIQFQIDQGTYPYSR
jgi:hypothetical protein